ncbi:hypothetical protein CPZ20_00070 [Lacticaseibacillus rhamnosus]|nr:hypothetical protein CPZ20_00070 [Lacticaseibacillus rhamnosus]PCL37807.1 hypothetical protein CPZ19_01460 [Lacticaseibacillus rhamnosus]PCL40919.1 hypothetical protein CPZ11_00070 [Lacticaseibacillus rhamnosus]PCL43815.1 hypothetical protein CPZ10_00070 [Lacticaseibacillus rhamnosus]
MVIAPKVLMCRFLGWRTRYGRKGELTALDVMTRSWSLHPRSLHADSYAGERVIESDAFDCFIQVLTRPLWELPNAAHFPSW